jgi:hypothetical protein
MEGAIINPIVMDDGNHMEETPEVIQGEIPEEEDGLATSPPLYESLPVLNLKQALDLGLDRGRKECLEICGAADVFLQKAGEVFTKHKARFQAMEILLKKKRGEWEKFVKFITTFSLSHFRALIHGTYAPHPRLGDGNGKKKNKKPKQENPAQPTEVGDAPDTTDWDARFESEPASEMAKVIFAALQHCEFHFANATVPLTYNKRMALLRQLLKDLGCNTAWAGKCVKLVYDARDEAKEKKKRDAAKKRAQAEYDAEHGARAKHAKPRDGGQAPPQDTAATQEFSTELVAEEKPKHAQFRGKPNGKPARSHHAKKTRKTAAQGGNGETAGQGGDGGINPPAPAPAGDGKIAPPVPHPDPRSFKSSVLDDCVRIADPDDLDPNNRHF